MRKHLAQKIFTIAFVLSLALSACQAAYDPAAAEQTMQVAVMQTLTAQPTATPIPATPTPTATPTTAPVAYGPTNFPSNINPLTGLEVDDPTILDRRPVMVKVANQASGRPHAGLSNADIVFDYYVGIGLDRFIALYYGTNNSKVGTVRSGRLVDRWLTRMYGGILGMISADPTVLWSLLASLGDRIILNEQCTAGYTAICNDGPKTEISAFANTAEMTRLYNDKHGDDNTRQNLDGMSFATIPPEGGVTGTQFTMHFGSNADHQWIYDESTKKYLQWSDDLNSLDSDQMIELVDRNTGEQLAFSNVVVIFAELDVLNGSLDSIHEYKIAGVKGRAMIFRDGKMYDVFYQAGSDTPITFVDQNGNPFALQPGNTWIHLTGLGSLVEESPVGTWKVTLGLP